MPNYHYYLRKVDKGSEARPVYLHVYLGGKRLVYPTGCKVLGKHWDDVKELAIHQVPTCARCIASPEANALSGAVGEAHRSINARLEQLKSVAAHFVTAFGREHNRVPDVHELREALHKSDGTPIGDSPTEVFAYFESFILRRKEAVHRNSTRRLHPTLHGRNQRALEYLKEFVASMHKGKLVPLHFNGLDADFITRFQSFLTLKKGFAVNTVGKYMRALREMLNDADRNGKGIEVPRVLLQRGAIPIPEEITTQVYLTAEELESMYQLDLSGHPRLEKARDLFLVGAWTGLRFGDLSRIRPEHIEGKVIRVPTAKTGREVVIPLHPIVTEVLAKYNGAIPSGISNQKQNDYIKEVAAQVPVLQVRIMSGRTQAGTRTEVPRYKWEMVSTHTARRSFATNLYRDKVPAPTIMAVTGHRTERAFLRYIRMSAEEHSSLIANSTLFRERRPSDSHPH